MNRLTFLQFIFNGYSCCFHKGLWHTSSNYSDVTTADLNFFTTLGQSLGFRVRREMNWNYPRDLSWCQTNEIKSDLEAKTFLYLERENKDGRAEITIEKMLNPKNAFAVPYLVAVFGWIREQTLAGIKKKIQSELPEEQSFLLISWVGSSQDGSDWILEGWCCSENMTSTRRLEVQTDGNGHWYALTNPNNLWL